VREWICMSTKRTEHRIRLEDVRIEAAIKTVERSPGHCLREIAVKYTGAASISKANPN